MFALTKLSDFFLSFAVITRRGLKQLIVTEKDNRTVVEGKLIPSTRKQYLVKPPPESNPKACPLCRLNLRRLNYSDVLILRQFMNSDGTMMSREESGLCVRQHRHVYRLISQAQKCRLLPRPEDYPVYGPWDSLNHYIDWPKRHRDQPMRVLKPEYWK